MDIDQPQQDGAQESWPQLRELASPAELHPQCPDCSGSNRDKQFHDICGFGWRVHDNTDLCATLPFGCPTETVARLRWGR